MNDRIMLKGARPRSRSRLGTSIRIVGLLLLGCSAASATALLYPGRGSGADPVRPVVRSQAGPVQPQPSPARPAAAAEPSPAKPLPAAAADPARQAPAVRQIPLSGGVDPTPATPPRVDQGRVQAASSDSAAPGQPNVSQAAAPAAPASTQKAPTDCLPAPLLAVLEDVQKRFGPVTLVSTTELHTHNHAPGGARHKMHAACRAVDFQVAGDLAAVAAYLRSRPEVGGVNVYKNNRVVHVDYVERKLARAER